MANVLGTLTVSRKPLEIGPLLRLSVDDSQDIPSFKTDYSDAVPIVHASSAVRRIAGLAYMLVWSWSEHLRAADQLRQDRARQIVLLFDEVEAHLHPRWQRAIAPALLEAMNGLTDDKTSIQLVAATHSPLVLASIEPHFDDNRDRLFHLDIDAGRVRLEVEPWAKQGDALNWLVSDVFGLKQGRSIEAETAIEAANAFMCGETSRLPNGLGGRDEIERALAQSAARTRPVLASLGGLVGTPSPR